VQHARRQGVGDRVEFLGGVSSEKILQLYHQADVTIYTSHQETFGHGIVESLGCGKPVVGPDWIIPCREILVGAPGSCAAPKDASRFAEAIFNVLSTDCEPGRLASYARDRYGNMAIASRLEVPSLSRERPIWTKLESINRKSPIRMPRC
jgi:glycosyltransferase involved in cell wall biosynthesis